jgi:6-phosphogluconolactonase (cycloisomerase 2 family)
MTICHLKQCRVKKSVCQPHAPCFHHAMAYCFPESSPSGCTPIFWPCSQGPAAIAISPDGSRVFVACRRSFKIVVFSVNGINGWLTFKPSSLSLLPSTQAPLDLVYLLAHGSFLFGTNPFPGSVHVFHADDNHNLREVASASTTKVNPPHSESISSVKERERTGLHVIIIIIILRNDACIPRIFLVRI